MASCTSELRPGSYSGASPSPHRRELIRDIHVGVCGHHAASCTLMGNTFCQGF
jgi:hypothetical protein